MCRFLLVLVLVPPLMLALACAAPAAGADVIHAPGPAGLLEGTFEPATEHALASPEQPAPVALIVPGSGPTDRDGNNPLGIRAAMYRLLAEGLAARGIASARVDKRGLFGSRSAIADPEAVTIADYAADVHAWSRAIRERTGATCIWVVGHSEGGLVALAAAEKADGLCGLVLLAAPGRPLGEVLRGQLRANPANAPLLSQAMAAIDDLEAGKRIDVTGLPQPLAILFRPSIQGFLVDAFARDPVKLIASVQRPVLIVQGGRDIQVGLDDAHALAKAQPAARLVILPTLNHVLKDVATDERAANVATYAAPDLPLAAGLADAIATFIKAAPAPSLPAAKQ